ncbi:GlxA family transcriptional regulator [Kiloniella laminariae]|uniref:GlxA family transcriptional regulator n=1 Tax=Kiloniella laminariae TaxID=454162 RepID=A0ABT4LMK9_9PROT|nr:GlxA family transcriptional regulator [Kiloniella laminariae]MCZ4282370.1 GlxA family transcriptional regulator [Kiloniella laminariae]
MFPEPKEGITRQVGFVLLPGFSMNSFTFAMEPLRVANKVARKPLYACPVFSINGETVEASNGLRLEVLGDLKAAALPENIILCGGHDIKAFPSGELLAWLRMLGRQSKVIGALYTASHYLAEARLIDDCKCAVHWEYLSAFNENFPDLETSNELFEVGNKRFTCVGGTAGLDMMLNFIADLHGFELARMVADQFVHERIRDRREFQYFGLSARYSIQDQRLLRVIKIMEEHLEEPLELEQLAKVAGASRRQLERMFSKQFNKSPARYYSELRLYRSRQLIMQTKMRIIEIALACGFNSSAHFSRCYRNFFGCTPLSERKLPGKESAVSHPDEPGPV